MGRATNATANTPQYERAEMLGSLDGKKTCGGGEEGPRAIPEAVSPSSHRCRVQENKLVAVQGVTHHPSLSSSCHSPSSLKRPPQTRHTKAEPHRTTGRHPIAPRPACCIPAARRPALPVRATRLAQDRRQLGVAVEAAGRLRRGGWRVGIRQCSTPSTSAGWVAADRAQAADARGARLMSWLCGLAALRVGTRH
jgi:hypothetical protein